MCACLRHEPEIANLIVKKGARLDLQQENGFTALMLACMYELPVTAQLIIKAGADLGVRDRSGWNALMYAIRYNQHETAQLLAGKCALHSRSSCPESRSRSR